MELPARTSTRPTATLVAAGLVVTLLALAHTISAHELRSPEYCGWIKEVWINSSGPSLITGPQHFGVVVSDTIHVRDRLFCDFAYRWALQEYWDSDVLSLSSLVYADGEIDEYPPGSLAWWGDQSASQWVQLDKYLHVDEAGWVTREISETVEFGQQEGPDFDSSEKPFYLRELVEGGDAPSSYNHTSSPMTATTFITGALATFPVVWDWDGSMDPAPPSYGFCHYSRLVPSFLGTAPSYELDADLTPDHDGSSNVDPPTNTPDRDGSDDGVTFPSVLPQCGTATVNVFGENNLGANLYLNAWADWNRDGDWEDISLCDCGVSEWIVQGYTVSPGSFDLNIEITSCHAVPDPTEPFWVRFTLSEQESMSGEPWIHGGQPYPASIACFWEGETEDYYVEPQLIPECEWDKLVYVNDELVEGWREDPVAVVVSDSIALVDSLSCNFEYQWTLGEKWEAAYLTLADHELSRGSAVTDTGTITWSGGPVSPGTTVTLTKTLHVDNPAFFSTSITETVQFSPEGWVESMEGVVDLVELLEGGDAPSGHNHDGSAMETYAGSGVWAQYPVAWDWDGTLGAGAVSGYYGFCHHSPGNAYLGSPPSFELDADLPPDQDVVTNIGPPSNADRDSADDGVVLPGGLPRCVTSTVTVAGHNGAGGTLYLNLWADWNRDGDWEDGTQCGCGDNEWAIQDHSISATDIDESIQLIPCHTCDPTEPLWIRVTLTEVPLAPLGTPWTYGGQPHPAPNGCFQLGETQDFLFRQHASYQPLLMKAY